MPLYRHLTAAGPENLVPNVGESEPGEALSIGEDGIPAFGQIDAANIVVVPPEDYTATNLQELLVEMAGPIDAANIVVVPPEGYTATNLQEFLVEMAGIIDGIE
jgi:hypothetical protein